MCTIYTCASICMHAVYSRNVLMDGWRRKLYRTDHLQLKRPTLKTFLILCRVIPPCYMQIQYIYGKDWGWLWNNNKNNFAKTRQFSKGVCAPCCGSCLHAVVPHTHPAPPHELRRPLNLTPTTHVLVGEGVARMFFHFCVWAAKFITWHTELRGLDTITCNTGMVPELRGDRASLPRAGCCFDL